MLFICTLPIFVFVGEIDTLPLVFWLISLPALVMFPSMIFFVGIQLFVSMSAYYFVAGLLARFMLRNAYRLGGLSGICAIVVIGTACIAATPVYCETKEAQLFVYRYKCSSLFGVVPRLSDMLLSTLDFLTGNVPPGI